MKNRVVFLSLIALVGIISLMTFLGESEDRELKELKFNSSEEDINTTEGGTKFLVHPDRLMQGCPSMDCIPSIDDPSFVSADGADWLQEDERVIGVEEEVETKAYPLKILSSHEIVNDRIDGEPIAVTYCPLCRSGVTYSREIGNQTLEFGVSGKLLNANLVMYDRGTESYWNQIEGKAIVGPRTGQELDLKFSSITTWKDWKEGHPDTKVLSRDTGIYPPSTYSGDPYSGYKASENVGFGVNNVDERLPAKELVYGVKVEGTSKAYTEKALNQEELIRDRIGNKSIILFKSPADGTVKAYSFEENISNTEFELSEEDLKNLDSKVEELKSLNPRGFYWFAWSKFNSETELYKSENAK